MPPFIVDSEPASLLYLINLTAGLLDGDGHLMELTARAGTRAVVTGQSATRIHPAQERLCHAAVAHRRRRRCLPGGIARPGDSVWRLPLLSAWPCQSGRAGSVHLGRHLAARPVRSRRTVGAVPVRADRPGLRGPPRGPPGLPGPVPVGWTVDPGGNRLVFRRRAGIGQPLRRGTCSRDAPRNPVFPPACHFSARYRRDLHTMVRSSRGRHE